MITKLRRRRPDIILVIYLSLEVRTASQHIFTISGLVDTANCFRPKNWMFRINPRMGGIYRVSGLSACHAAWGKLTIIALRKAFTPPFTRANLDGNALSIGSEGQLHLSCRKLR